MQNSLNRGDVFSYVSMQSAKYQRIGNMPKACPYNLQVICPLTSNLILDIGEDWGGGAVGVFVDVELHHSVVRLVAVADDVGGFSLCR